MAVNAQEGFEACRLSPERFDLVILVLIMPTMGGHEAFTEIRRSAPSVPVLLSSGFSKEEDMQALRDQGTSGFLQKP